MNPGKVEMTWKFADEKTATAKLAVDCDTGELAQRDERAVKFNAMNQRIARVTKSSLFFPTFRRIEGEFSYFFR